MTDLPKFEDWKAPWEKEGEEFDPAKFDNNAARKYLHNLLSDKARLQASNQTLTTERDELKAKVTEFETKDLSENERLKRENEELRKNPPQVEGKPNVTDILIEKAAEKNLSTDQLNRMRKWIKGDSVEEISAAADEYIAEHYPDGGGDGNQPPRPPTDRPKVATQTGLLDGTPDTPDGHYPDPLKALEALKASR